MCDTSLSNQRRYAPRVAEMTGLGGRFDRNTHSFDDCHCRAWRSVEFRVDLINLWVRLINAVGSENHE
jgi:hypothetical protein